MASYIARALIETETWQSIQAQPYDGERYPCGCHPHPKRPHIHFRLCDYHDGFDAGVDQGQRLLRAEIVRLRAEVERLMDGMELAWAIIANGQYWDATDVARQAEWEQAKFAWRDEHWHPALDRNNEARRG